MLRTDCSGEIRLACMYLGYQEPGSVKLADISYAEQITDSMQRLVQTS